jgi:hypothetical protein
MEILNFKTSLKDIKNGKFELADISKSSLWQHAPHWLDILDFESDDTFLEPSLFFYFRRLARQERPPKKLEQILFGYTPNNAKNTNMVCKSDSDGIIYMPNLGCIDTKTTGVKDYIIDFSSDRKNAKIDNKILNINPCHSVQNNQFIIISHKPEIYDEVLGAPIIYLESVNDSIDYAQFRLATVLNKMKKSISDFYNAIKLTTKEFGIFNSNNVESFAALHYFGTAFLNLAGQKQTEVFFLDDVAHQAGHTVFFALTHDYKKFLKPDIHAKLKNYNNVSYEQRNVYGAFHGLFTYTTIMHCLHIALSEKWFTGKEEEEAISRLGFYYEKFEKDLCGLGDNRILTEEGWRYYDMFYSGFVKMKKEYYHIIKYFDYSNQNYNYNFEKFKEVNQFQTV